MAVDQAVIGRTYPPKQAYEVSRAKIAEFAEAIGDTSPLSRDVRAARDAGYPDVLAPPTFLTIVNLGAIDVLIADPGLSLDYDRMVHGDQGFVFERPVHAGDRLKTTTSIDDVYTRAGNDFVTLRAAVHADTGELVCTARAQLVVRGEA